MPFDPVPAAQMAPEAPVRPLNLLYVLSSFPVLSETFVSNEIRAMRALGHKVVPLTIRDHHGPCQPEDEALKPGIQRLEDLPRVLAMLRALAGPRRLRAALDFIRAQQGLPGPSLLGFGRARDCPEKGVVGRPAVRRYPWLHDATAAGLWARLEWQEVARLARQGRRFAARRLARVIPGAERPGSGAARPAKEAHS
ncbi:hypothetical protein [Sediminicoccus sp. BL-A-41-H5]|uniref:hypothetical protein n=1 Tax=Sediminicoccus sp. BL-A-41-H5 TaxID=3421106 RepID=UPI003D671D92